MPIIFNEQAVNGDVISFRKAEFNVPHGKFGNIVNIFGPLKILSKASCGIYSVGSTFAEFIFIVKIAHEEKAQFVVPNVEAFSARNCVTGFYKNIKNAINRIEVNSAASELSYVNTGDANVAGIEFELRKDIIKFSDDSDSEKSLTFGLNGSYLYSNQKLEDVPTDDLTVRFTNEEDELEGSSPLVLGSDLTLNLKKGSSGITSSLVFNYNSESIYSLGTGGDDANPGSGKNNIMLSSVATLDFINKIAVNENLGIKINIKNILDPEYKLSQDVNNIGVDNPSLPDGEETTIETFKRGVFFSAGISYSF